MALAGGTEAISNGPCKFVGVAQMIEPAEQPWCALGLEEELADEPQGLAPGGLLVGPAVSLSRKTQRFSYIFSLRVRFLPKYQPKVMRSYQA